MSISVIEISKTKIREGRKQAESQTAGRRDERETRRVCAQMRK